MYDAYISYFNTENDRKFVNFILKPHLENKYSHKLLPNDTNILPGAGKSHKLCYMKSIKINSAHYTCIKV